MKINFDSAQRHVLLSFGNMALNGAFSVTEWGFLNDYLLSNKPHWPMANNSGYRNGGAHAFGLR